MSMVLAGRSDLMGLMQCSMFSASTEVSLLGDTTTLVVGGNATFDRVGLGGHFGASAVANFSCSWGGDATASENGVQVLVLGFEIGGPSIGRRALQLKMMPHALRSSGAFFNPLTPPPMQCLTWSTPTGPQPLALELPCSLRIVTSWPDSLAFLMGKTGTSINASTGCLVFDELGVSAPPGTVLQLAATCDYLGLSTIDVDIGNVTMDSLKLRWTLDGELAEDASLGALPVALPGHSPDEGAIIPLSREVGIEALVSGPSAAYPAPREVTCSVAVNAAFHSSGALPVLLTTHGNATMHKDQWSFLLAGPLAAEAQVTLLLSFADSTDVAIPPGSRRATFSGTGLIGDSSSIGALGATCLLDNTLYEAENVIFIESLDLGLSLGWGGHTTPQFFLPSQAAGTGSALIPLSPDVNVTLHAGSAFAEVPSSDTLSSIELGETVSCSLDLDPKPAFNGSAFSGESLGIELVDAPSVPMSGSPPAAVFSDVGIAGPMGAAGLLTATCLWVSGELLHAVARTIVAVPPHRVVWAQPPSPFFLFNTELDEFSVAFEDVATGGSVPVPAFFDPAALSCSVAAVDASGSAMSMQGLTTASVLQGTHTVHFSSALSRIAFSSPESAIPLLSNVTITAQCSFNGQQLEPVSATTAVQALELAWSTAPPAESPPVSRSAGGQVKGTLDAFSVVLLNHTTHVLVQENGALCTASYVLRGTADTRAMASATMTGGQAKFEGLYIDEPFGSNVTLRVQCEREQGGPSYSVEASIQVAPLHILPLPPAPALQVFNHSTLQINALVVLGGGSPPWLGAAAPTRLMQPANQSDSELASAVAAASGFFDWEGVSQPRPLDILRMSCTISIAAAPNASSMLSLAGSLSVTPSSKGEAGLTPSIVGLAGDAGDLLLTCSVGSHSTSKKLFGIGLPRPALHWLVPPPSMWFPSNAQAEAPMSPAPTLEVRAESGVAMSVRDSAGGYFCDILMSTHDARAISLLQPPDGGFQNSELGATQIALSPLMPMTGSGTLVSFTVACQRTAGDEPLTLSWETDFPLLGIEVAMPAFFSILPDDEASLIFPEVQVTALETRPGADFSPATFLSTDAVFCSVSVVAAEEGAFFTGTGPFRLTATSGRVSWIGTAGINIRGARESTGELRLACFLGSSQIGQTVVSGIKIRGCNEGEEPQVEQGRPDKCQPCDVGEYSLGGDMPCTTCPTQGVECTNGLITPSKDYFLQVKEGATQYINATSGTVLLDASSELHPCFFPNAGACLVDQDLLAYSCAPGYIGPRCGICDVNSGYARDGDVCSRCSDPAVNWLIVAAMGVALLAGLVYISQRKVTSLRDRKFDSIAGKIFMSYAQALGALGLYAAKGTATFRRIMGATEAVAAGGILGAQPITCVTNGAFNYYFMTYATFLLPAIVAVLVVLVSIAVIILKHCSSFKARAAALAAASSKCSPAAIEQEAVREAEEVEEAAEQEEVSMTPREAVGGDGAANSNDGLDVAQDSDDDFTALGPGTREGESASDARKRRAAAAEAAEAADAQRQLLLPLGTKLYLFIKDKQYIAVVLGILFLTYTTSTSRAFQVLDCDDETVGGVRYLAVDMATPCEGADYVLATVLSVTVLCVLGLGFPLAFARYLVSKRHKLKQRKFFMRFGFMYEGLSIDRGTFWYESVTLIRKAGIVMLASLITDAFNQIMAALFLVNFFLVLHLRFRPYAASKHNNLETMTLICLSITQSVSMLYFRAERALAETAQEGDVALEIMTTIALTLPNLACGLVCIAAVLRLGPFKHSLPDHHGDAWHAEMKLWEVTRKPDVSVEEVDAAISKLSDTARTGTYASSRVQTPRTAAKVRRAKRKSLVRDQDEQHNRRQHAAVREAIGAGQKQGVPEITPEGAEVLMVPRGVTLPPSSRQDE